VLENITVTNGTIRDFSAIGIFSYNGSFDGGASELSFKNLQFLDLNIVNCGLLEDPLDFGQGINLDSAVSLRGRQVQDFSYRAVVIQNCHLLDTKGAAAIQIYTVEGLVIDKCQVNGLRTISDRFDLGLFGITLFGQNIQIFNSQSVNMSYEDSRPLVPGGSHNQCGALAIQVSNDILVKDSQFNNVFGRNAYIVNSNLSRCQNDVYINCQFNDYRGGDLARIVCCVHRSSGFFQATNGKSSRFINCQFNKTRIDASNPGGFDGSELGGFRSFSTNGDIFEGCQFCDHNVETNENYRAYGALIGTLPYAEDETIEDIGGAYCQTFRDCFFNDIKGGPYAVGLFSWVGDINYDFEGIAQYTPQIQTNIVMENCIASKIRSIGAHTEIVAGLMEGYLASENETRRPNVIQTWFSKMRNLQIKNCRVSDVRSSSAIARSAGILVESVMNPEVSDNSVSDCDRGILLTGTDTLFPNAFQLATTEEDAIQYPPRFVDISFPIPDASPEQVFSNLTTGNSITIAPSLLDPAPFSPPITQDGTVSPSYDMIFPRNNQDLTSLGWKPGHLIRYNANGGQNIEGLVSGTTYYLVVYSPGFSEDGLISNNKVSKCGTGFEDARPKHTTSAWLSNVAFCNDHNYEIAWKCHVPVAKGSLHCYPKPKYNTYNISINK